MIARRATMLRRLGAHFVLLALAAACGSCDGIEPLRPRDAAPDDGDLVRGCPSLRMPVALPGDDIGGDDYESYATGFFEAWCTRCHSTANVTMDERMDAPLGYDWDDRDSVYEHLEEIRDVVGVFNYMPIDDPKPSCEERLRFIRWIDAGAP